jgi:hypothetical protein
MFKALLNFKLLSLLFPFIFISFSARSQEIKNATTEKNSNFKKEKINLRFNQEMDEFDQFEATPPPLCDPTDPERISIVNDYIKTHEANLSSEDQKLIKFIAGDCLPVVIVPGFYGNKLQLHITNCTALNLYHPEVAKACKFDQKCEDGSEKFFWLSEDFESNDGSTCFGEVVKFNIFKNETEKDPMKKFQEKPTNGFRLVYTGNTPKTEKINECGFGASTNLLDKLFYFGAKSVRGLLDMKNHFVSLGYQIGVNLFSVPYDWRRTSNDPYNYQMMKTTVDLAYKLTGKKSVLVAHSYGSLIALDYVYTLTEEEKSKKIDRIVGIGPVYGGVSKAVKSFVLGYEEFNIDVKFLVEILNIYLSLPNQKIFMYKNGAPVELFQKLFWTLHKDEHFMKVARERNQAEEKITQCVRDYFRKKEDKGKKEFLEGAMKVNESLKFLDEMFEVKGSIYDFFNKKHLKTSNEEDSEIINYCIIPIKNAYFEVFENFKKLFPFYPDLEEGCGKVNLVQTTCLKSPTQNPSKAENCKNSVWDKYCRLNFFIPFDVPTVEIKDNDKNYSFDLLTKESISDMVSKFGIGKPDMEYFNYVLNSINPELHKLNHPKVPVTIYFTSGFETTVTYSIPQNPKIFTDKNQYAVDALGQDIVNNSGGDGTVPTASAILPVLKWTTEKTEKFYPVHLVNYCANKDFNKPLDLNNHQFINIDCRCDKPLEDGCAHASMAGDQNIIDHIENYTRNKNNNLPASDLLKNIDLVSKGINQVQNGHVCSNLKDVEELFRNKYSR